MLNPLPWVAWLWDFASLLAMLVSILGVIYTQGERRAAWIGFALFAWTHAGALRDKVAVTGTVAPPFTDEIGGWVADTMLTDQRLERYRSPDVPGRNSGRYGFRVAFNNVVEAIMTIPYGLLGAFVATRFYRLSASGREAAGHASTQ